MTGEEPQASVLLSALAGAWRCEAVRVHTMPAGGLELIRRVLQRDAQARVLVFSMHEEPVFATQALEAGADGYLLKTVETEQLCDSIENVLAGECVISPDMMTKFVTAFRSKAPALREVADAMVPQPVAEDATLESLSAREREILALNTDRVIRLAARWSVDPTSVSGTTLEGQGIAGDLLHGRYH